MPKIGSVIPKLLAFMKRKTSSRQEATVSPNSTARNEVTQNRTWRTRGSIHSRNRSISSSSSLRSNGAQRGENRSTRRRLTQRMRNATAMPTAPEEDRHPPFPLPNAGVADGVEPEKVGPQRAEGGQDEIDHRGNNHDDSQRTSAIRRIVSGCPGEHQERG